MGDSQLLDDAFPMGMDGTDSLSVLQFRSDWFFRFVFE